MSRDLGGRFVAAWLLAGEESEDFTWVTLRFRLIELDNYLLTWDTLKKIRFL
jgi:hypothetical protein